MTVCSLRLFRGGQDGKQARERARLKRYVNGAAGQLDSGGQDLVVDFAPYGLLTFRNNTTWVYLHGLPIEGLELADRDGGGKDEVLIDFGQAYGLWQYTNDSAWSHQHALNPESMAYGRFH